ncbi:glycoside hydrolase family 88 protein [Granulicella sp. 5B5]|uniref:glycoside hydrolase family 88 protein n=1 Tax=Granulicella sp. 5B5 TaxID=1617967 RepID=UPI0021074722|nr:glycoside hydrolase family 88 protein [Granulicella sp. 5B5]
MSVREMRMSVALAACAMLTVGAMAQATNDASWPKPTPAMQAGIDKDISRHFGDAPADPGPIQTDLSPALTAAAIDKAERKVADWQLKVAEPYFDRIWTWSVLYSGFMAASESTGDPKYKDAMAAMAKKYNYELRSKMPNADDQSVGQTYLELYLLDGKKDAAMMTPTQAGLDSVIGLPTLRSNDPRIPWWWCDALFMGPPTWARMAKATGDHKYIDYLNANWAKTYAALWDADEHLYARDETYKDKRAKNGKKIFWSRGEGWVMGGIARTLDYLPADDPHRGFYEQNLREMAARVAELQRPDGLWPSSLLDGEDFPQPEISGAALMVYGMAWGVDHGVLDRAKYEPVIAKAWAGILQHVYADGRLGDIQQTGAEPAYYPASASFTYGVGGYLLAAAELKTMAAKSSQVAAVNTDPGRTRHIPVVQRKPGIPTIWLIGDSTVRNGNGDGAHNQMGWGDELAPYFNTDKVNVANEAIGGRSSRTYITEGHWAEALALMKPGDVMLVQFGHNDSGKPDEPTRARASLPGVSDETQTIFNPITKQQEVVHTFGWYEDEMVREAKAKGVTPILCSLIPRKIWRDGKVVRNKDTYAGWTEEVAKRDHVGFVDLNDITADKYDKLGEAAVEPLFGDPHTHTTVAGAVMNAESVVAGLKALKHDPVAKDFSAKGKAIAAYKP